MASIAAAWPIVTGAIGVVSAIARYASGSSKKTDEDVKYTLVPPLIDQRVDRNQAIRAPQQAWRRHRRALLDAHFIDGQCLIGNVRLQPAQSIGGHDIEALVRVPSSQPNDLLSTFHPSLQSEIAAETQSHSHHAHWFPVSGGPIADVIARVQPSTTQSTFIEAQLSSETGGIANIAGCYQLPVERWIKRWAGKDPAIFSPLNKSSYPHVALFGHAPLFESDNALMRSQQSTDLGMRIDHLSSSIGVSVNPTDPDLIQGWLTSATSLSELGRTSLRGGVEFTTSTKFDTTPQFNASMYYTQAADIDQSSSNLSVDLSGNVRPAYEIGLEVRRGGEELTASFFNHQAVRRAIRNPLEDKSVIQIVNYIELGLELNLARHQQPTWRTAASWQINKNSMVKMRLSENKISAAYAFRSWWSPSIAFSAALHRSLTDGSVTAGLELTVENLNAVVFGKAPEAGYVRKIQPHRLNVTRQVATGNY